MIIHEVLIPAAGADLSVPNAIRDYHTTPEQAADVFKQTAPRLAVYTHIVSTVTMGPGGVVDSLSGFRDKGSVVRGRVPALAFCRAYKKGIRRFADHLRRRDCVPYR